MHIYPTDYQSLILHSYQKQSELFAIGLHVKSMQTLDHKDHAQMVAEEVNFQQQVQKEQSYFNFGERFGWLCQSAIVLYETDAHQRRTGTAEIERL